MSKTPLNITFLFSSLLVLSSMNAVGGHHFSLPQNDAPAAAAAAAVSHPDGHDSRREAIDDVVGLIEGNWEIDDSLLLDTSRNMIGVMSATVVQLARVTGLLQTRVARLGHGIAQLQAPDQYGVVAEAGDGTESDDGCEALDHLILTPSGNVLDLQGVLVGSDSKLNKRRVAYFLNLLARGELDHYTRWDLRDNKLNDEHIVFVNMAFDTVSSSSKRPDVERIDLSNNPGIVDTDNLLTLAQYLPAIKEIVYTSPTTGERCSLAAKLF